MNIILMHCHYSNKSSCQATDYTSVTRCLKTGHGAINNVVGIEIITRGFSAS
jgi:hypothetical protein